jgi:hypothetical protein
MPIYEISDGSIRALDATSFTKAKLKERSDLQGMLRDNIDAVCADVLVIAESFRDWEGSNREVDLLGIDKQANLVVIELKRDDAGHAELQAIRYAAMVSTMTYQKAIAVYSAHLKQENKSDAEGKLLEFLEWDEPQEDDFAQNVRIVLVSSAFSKEITTSVMWLNERNMDIRCVRMNPYQDGHRVLVDVQQLIPLPEAADYIIRVREKEMKTQEGRRQEGERQELRRAFWESLFERAAGKTPLFENISPSPNAWVSTGSGLAHLNYGLLIYPMDTGVQVNFWSPDSGLNKARLDCLCRMKEKIEGDFGTSLIWRSSESRKQTQVRFVLEGGGCQSPREDWSMIQDKMIDAVIRLEKVISPHIETLRQVTAPSKT